MRAFLAILERELRQRWMLLPAALLVGFLPFVAAAFGQKEAADPAAIGLIVLSMGIVAALLAGYGVVAGELGGGRLAFFFARPVPWWTIWSGKLSSAFVLAVACSVLATVPRLVQPRGSDVLLPLVAEGSLWNVDTWLAAGAFLLLAIGLAHAAGTAWASRSGLVAVDLALFGASLWLLWVMRAPLIVGLRSLLYARPGPLLAGPAISLALALLVASAVQVWSGRTDARRGHRALSATFWSLLLCGLATLGGFGWWQLRRPPADLQRVVFAAAAPGGEWVWIDGEMKGSRYWFQSFLHNTQTGRFARLGPSGATTRPVFSADGRRAAFLVADWTREHMGWAEARLRLMDLGPDASWHDISLGVPPMPGNGPVLAFTPGGDGLLMVQAQALTLYALPSGRRLWSAPPVHGAWMGPPVFVDAAHVRAFRRQDADIEIVSGDLRTGAFLVTGRIPEAHGWPLPNPSGDTLLLLGDEWQRQRVSLHDAATGRRLALLIDDGWHVDAGFLPEGRVAVVQIRGLDAFLTVFRPDGSEERRLELGRAVHVVLGGMVDDRQLLVGLRLREAVAHEIAVVDLSTGGFRKEKGVFPAESSWSRTSAPSGALPGPGAAAFVVTDRGSLIRLHPDAGVHEALPGLGR